MRSIKKTVEEKVITYLEKNRIEKDSDIIVAFSAGPDSTVLLAVLSDVYGYNFTITALYFNHNLRPMKELENEILCAEKTAESLGVRLITGTARAGEIRRDAAERNSGIEEAARDARYRFFYKIKEEINADYIAVGHNLDDNAETMLMRFLQNSGTGGLSGIPEKRGCIIRPLCNISRSQIEQYLDESGLDYSRDSTNSEKDFMRNRIRHEVVPIIRGIFPEFDESMHALSDKIKLDNSFIDEETAKRIIWKPAEEGWKTSLDVFYRQHESLKIRSLFSILNKMNVGGRISSRALKNAVSVPAGNGKSLLTVSGIEVYTAAGFIFARRLVNRNKKSYLLYLKPGKKCSVSGQNFIIFNKDHSSYPADGMKCMVLEAANSSPLVLRSYRSGDVIKTVSGTKSLKKLFNDWKIDSGDRYRVPIIEDVRGITAVVGEHLGYENITACGLTNQNIRLKKILLFYSSDTETTCE